MWLPPGAFVSRETGHDWPRGIMHFTYSATASGQMKKEQLWRLSGLPGVRGCIPQGPRAASLHR